MNQMYEAVKLEAEGLVQDFGVNGLGEGQGAVHDTHGEAPADQTGHCCQILSLFR